MYVHNHNVECIARFSIFTVIKMLLEVTKNERTHIESETQLSGSFEGISM